MCIHSKRLENVKKKKKEKKKNRKYSSWQRTVGTTEHFRKFRFYLSILPILFDELSIKNLYKDVISNEYSSASTLYQ